MLRCIFSDIFFSDTRLYAYACDLLEKPKMYAYNTALRL